jgi:primosomal protein N' (replication factor Y)
MVDSPLPHLDRPFDYLVPAELDAEVQPGSRTRVRFAGRLIDAWVLERLASTDHDGALAYLERGVGAEPILTAETAQLFRAIADRWAGSFADVVRLGVPPRHARAEAGAVGERAPRAEPPTGSGWGTYQAGQAFLRAVSDGRQARAVWNMLPGEDWPARVSEAVQSAASVGRGAIVVVPDARDVTRLDRALRAVLPRGSHVSLTADLGPETRYRRWLAVRRATVRIVIGNRAAGYAPVADLGLVVVIDDGDDLHAEPRAPYPHARDVAILRASQTGCALLLAGFSQTAEGALLVQSGWAHRIAPLRMQVRAASARVIAAGDDVELERDAGARSARIPAIALRTARESLASGRPVLVQVPRRGYLPSLACARDRTPVRCVACHGPVAATSGHATPVCGWCGRLAGDWSCPACSGDRLRAVAVGSSRTAEEIGRAFPGFATRTSAGDHILDEVPADPALIVATPGAEPIVSGGYGAALLLDGWAMLSRADLRAAEETLRRWSNAVALVAPDGRVVVGADSALAPVQALLRWDQAGFAERELADRVALGFPPASRLAALTGSAADVRDLLAATTLPMSAQELGTAPAGLPTEGVNQVRTIIRVPRTDGARLAEALHAAAAVRSARKAGGAVRIVLDPVELV